MNQLNQNKMNDNKLIAEFMNHGFHDGRHRSFDELKYHESWDWLMPVVSKCRDESNEEDSHWEAIYYSLEGCDIDVTYHAVVEFINQYNDERQ